MPSMDMQVNVMSMIRFSKGKVCRAPLAQVHCCDVSGETVKPQMPLALQCFLARLGVTVGAKQDDRILRGCLSFTLLHLCSLWFYGSCPCWLQLVPRRRLLQFARSRAVLYFLCSFHLLSIVSVHRTHVGGRSGSRWLPTGASRARPV